MIRWLVFPVSHVASVSGRVPGPPRLLVTRIADSDLPFGGSWTFELEPEGAATRLTITENGEVYNPFFRFMARFVFGHEGTARAYLEDLRRRLQRDGARAARP